MSAGQLQKQPTSVATKKFAPPSGQTQMPSGANSNATYQQQLMS